MLSRAYPEIPKRVRPSLVDLQARASTRLRYDPDDNYRVRASKELDEAVTFYSYLYGVATVDIARVLGVTEGAVRKRIARTPIPDIDYVDVDKYVDAPVRNTLSDAYYRIRVYSDSRGRRRFLIDYVYNKGLVDYSTNPDPDMPVCETIQELITTPVDSEVYISDVVYKYFIAEVS